MLKKIMLWVAAGYALVIALVIGLGLIVIPGMDRLHSINRDIYAHPFMVNDAGQEAKAAIALMRADMLNIASPNSPEELERLAAETFALDKDARKSLVAVEANFLGDRGRINETKHLLDAWQSLRAQEIDLAMHGKMNQAHDLAENSGTRIFTQLLADMDYVIGFSRQKAEAFVAEADTEAATKISLIMWMLAVLIASIGFSGWYVAHRISLLIHREQQMEEALRKNSVQLETANKELESFSYSVSHDLRSPLRAIDGFSHILLEDYADKLDDEGKRLLNVVRDNTSRMGQLIDDILKFSRTGRLELAYAEINMEKLACEVVEELQPVGGKLQVDIEPISPVTGDRAMMHQVFVNLLSNAIKFSRSKADARITVGGSIEGDEAVYFVKDNGAGFDMQYADKLFGMFQRLHGVSEFEGTGIGLAIVKSIITRHGGRVWAEGKLNEGATIYFALPTKEAAQVMMSRDKR